MPPNHIPDDRGITVCHVSEGGAVYGGRGPQGQDILSVGPPTRGWLGNPYRLSEGYSREQSVRRYAQVFLAHASEDPAFASALGRLRGRPVACFCRYSNEDGPLCHLDVVNTYLQHGRDAVVDRFRHNPEPLPSP